MLRRRNEPRKDRRKTPSSSSSSSVPEPDHHGRRTLCGDEPVAFGLKLFRFRSRHHAEGSSVTARATTTSTKDDNRRKDWVLLLELRAFGRNKMVLEIATERRFACDDLRQNAGTSSPAVERLSCRSAGRNHHRHHHRRCCWNVVAFGPGATFELEDLAQPSLRGLSQSQPEE